MTSFHDADGRKIVSTASAETVGKVDGFVVDPTSRSVVALQVKKSASDGDTLTWKNVVGFGADAVTVKDPTSITEAPADVAALQGKDHTLIGKRLLTTGGVDVGKIKDVEFDPATGALTSIVAKEGSAPGSALTGVGSYAVVVAV